MSNSKLKTKIKNLVKNELAEYHFHLIKPRLIERILPDLIQGIEFQPGNGHLDGKYTLNIYWRFKFAEKDFISFDGCSRIGELMNQNDVWFSREEELEKDFEYAKKSIFQYVLPYLEKNSSLKLLVDNYEKKKINISKAFGLDQGWQCFNLGFSYIEIGNHKKGLEELNKVINEHSKENYEWIQNRKSIAQSKIEEIIKKFF